MSQFRAGIDVSKDTYNIIKGNSSGIWIGSNTSTININSSKLNISSLNVSIVTNYDGVEFLHNPTITVNTLDPAERSRHIPTTEWVNSYFDSRLQALNLKLNSSVVPYGVNLLELKRIPFQTSPSIITPTLPENTTRVSLLILGPGGDAGANVSSLNGTNVSFGIGGAGGSGAAVYYPSILCNFSKPFSINFSYSTDANNNPMPVATVISYSPELLSRVNVSLRNKIIAIAYGGSKGEDTTYDTPGAQGPPGSSTIYYTYGQSVGQPGSLNVSGNGDFYTGLINTSKTLKNYGGNNLLSYEVNESIRDNVGGSQNIIYDTNTINVETINAGKGAVYLWCWNDTTTLQLNTTNTFNVSNGLGTQYNRLNNESQLLSYRDVLNGPEKVFSITNVSRNCSIMYIDNIESKPLDFYTTGGYKFNASVTNMSIFPSNNKPIRVTIGENATTINNAENTIQLGNESVVTRVNQINGLDTNKKLVIGNLQTDGGITIGADTSIPHTILLNANNTNLSTVLIDAKRLNLSSSNLSIRTNGFDAFQSDSSGQVTIGNFTSDIVVNSTIRTNGNIIMPQNATIQIGSLILANTNGSSISSNSASIVTSMITVTGPINVLYGSNLVGVNITDTGFISARSLTIGDGNASITLEGDISGKSATIYGPINVSTNGMNTASISSGGAITGTSINVSNNASISAEGFLSVKSINVSNIASITSAGAISGTSATIYGPINVSNNGINTLSISSTGDIIAKSAVFTNSGTINASISSGGAITGTSINISSDGVNRASISSTGVINGTSIIFSTLGTINASISSDGNITGTSINVSNAGVTTASITSAGDITGKSAVFTNGTVINASISSGGAITGTSLNISNGTLRASISSAGAISGTSATINGPINVSNTASISSAGLITGTTINVSNAGVTTASISSVGAITGTSAMIYGSVNVSNGGSINVSNAGVTTASISSAGAITGTSATINGGLTIKNGVNTAVSIASNGTINGYNNLFISGDISTTTGGSVYVSKDITAQSATINGPIIVHSDSGRVGSITADGNINSYGNIIASGGVYAPNIFVEKFESVSPTTNITIGGSQTFGAIIIGNNSNGGISIGSGTTQSNTILLNANNASLNKMQINASNMSIDTDTAVFKVLRSLGLTANSNNILTLDTSGNTTLGNASNVTMINSSLCLFNSSTLSLNSNGLNTIFSDIYGNVTVGNSAGTTNIMSLKQINFNTPLVTFSTPTTNSTPKGLCITNSGIMTYSSYQAPGVVIYCGEVSSINTTENVQDPFCICSPSGGTNVSSNVSGALTLGLGVDTLGRFGYINCAEFGFNRDIYLASRGNASVYIGNPSSQIGDLKSNLYVNGITTITGNMYIGTATITSAGAITATSAAISGNINSTGGSISTASGSISSAGAITATSAAISGAITGVTTLTTTGRITAPSSTINGDITIPNAGLIRFTGTNANLDQDPTTGAGLWWGKGYSKIIDNGELRICTDNYMYFHIGSDVVNTNFGTQRFYIDQNGVRVTGNVYFANQGNEINWATYGSKIVGDIYLRLYSNDYITFTTGGVQRGYFSTTNFTVDTPLNVGNSVTCNQLILSGYGNIIKWPSYDSQIWGDNELRLNSVNIIRFHTAWSERMRLESGGAVVTGYMWASGTVTAGSDRKIKKDIVTVENALDKVKKLRGVNFTYIENDKKSMGVIAQEIQDVIPEVVSENDGTLGVNYGALAGVFIEAIKEMDLNHETCIKEITYNHEKEINELKDRICILEEMIKKLI